MKAATARSAQELLDAVHTRARLADASPARYAAVLVDEVAAIAPSLDGLAQRDAQLAAARSAIGRFTGRVARILLDHALVDDTTLGAGFRAHLAATVEDAATAPGEVRARVAQAAARTAPTQAGAVAATVMDALAAALASRDALLAEVDRVTQTLAGQALEVARARAADHAVPDSARLQWSAARQELAAILVDPARVAAAPWATRLAEHDAIDEAPVVEAPAFGSLIELD
ncbi:MAG: hypothetical protein R3B06_18355 [Kofleriaceae bacterium]